jgi:hypothetical protein
MGSRSQAGVVVLLVGVVAAFAWWAIPFEAPRSITADTNVAIGGEPELTVVDVHVSCSLDGPDHLTDGNGQRLFFNSASPWVPAESTSEQAECDAARNERLATSAAIALLGVLAGVLLLSSDRARANRAEAAALEADAAEATTGT